MTIRIWKIACTGILFLGIVFHSCNDDGFRGFGHLVNPRTTVGVIDTVTIKVSNMIAADSVVTSFRQGRNFFGFSGAYFDPQIGTVDTRTYIEFSRTSDGESNRFARFDSVTLVMRSNGNYYGDTTQYAAFKVSKILYQIEKQDDGNLYSTSTVPVGAVLADTAFKIKVKDLPNNEFEIKLPREFGENLFQGILRNEEDFSVENFLKTFPGLSVSAGAESACVHGLNIQDTACMIRIYYHVYTSQKDEKKMEFKANIHNSFSHWTCNRKESLQYDSKSDPVPSSETDDKGIIMSGFPMFVRLEFPHLNELLWLGQEVFIQRATLYVRPVQRSFDTIPLPPKLNLYYFNPRENTVIYGSAIGPPGGNQQAAAQDGNLPADYQNLQSPNFPQYTFDVTNFIASQIGKSGFDLWALSLLIPDDARENSFQRLVIGNQNYWYKNDVQSNDNRIKLEIVYMVYND